MSEDYLPVVVGVAVVADHVLRLLFSDATAGDVDFSAERWTGVLEPLSDPAYFARVRVDPEAGTIVWPGGIDLAKAELSRRPRSAVPTTLRYRHGPSLRARSRRYLTDETVGLGGGLRYRKD